MSQPADPFAAIAALPGVGVAAAHARDAIDALLRQPAMRRDASRVAAESAVRGALASAALDGARAEDLDDSVTQGALRATAEVPALAGVWSGAPGQALARIHLLAAKDLAGVESLGRPRDGIDRARFDQLFRLAVAPTAAPAVVVAALVHGELATIRPFGLADGVVARAAERMVLIARGVDTRAVSVPEAGHAGLVRAYGQLLEAYATGTSDGVGAWVRHCCEAYARGAEEGIAICRSLA
ncbi:MAG TPA: oxidoreductase [Jiangellaceae bacterium]|nr:oxidoreductase [Jiangellaceae bacterium]